MPKGYRRYIVAAFGWLILAAQAPSQLSETEGRGPANNVAEARTERPGQSVPVEIGKPPPEPLGYQDPCQGNESDNRSDLCAQWTAARAASDAARYARWQVYAAIAGTAGLIVTLVLTLRALFAAQRSANAAAEQVEIMREQQRPDLIVAHMGYYRLVGPAQNENVDQPVADGIVSVSVANRNQSLVYVEHSEWGYVVANDLPAEPIYGREIEFRAGRDPRPGQPIEFTINLPLVEAELADIAQGAHLWIWFRLEVSDVFGAKHILGFAAKWSDQKMPVDALQVLWGNVFAAVFDPAYHYRERQKAAKPPRV